MLLLRRSLAAPVVAALAATCSSVGNSHHAVATHRVLHVSRRSESTSASAAPAGGRGGFAGRGNSSNRARVARPPLPPAFDVVHWNDDNVAKGHLLRIVHRDSFLVLDYHQQRRRGDDDGAGARSERIVTVTLPPVYIARLLGVLEGRMERVDVQSRFTNAVFAPDMAKGKHHYTLKCASMRPTTGQQQSIDGNDLNEDTIEWEVSFDPAESLMLQRFLSEALRYNSGFARRSTDA